MGFAVASKNPRHAFSSALSAEKKRAKSRIAHRNRKWGLAEWVNAFRKISQGGR